MAKGSTTKSGVFIYKDLRDNLIIDRYNPKLYKMSVNKQSAFRSENSEDALTWNVFQTFRQLDPVIWLPLVFAKSFNADLPTPAVPLELHLWKKLDPPQELREGPTEADIVLETDKFVWIIEAKYKSDIELRTTHGEKRDQVIRNIDVGSSYAKNKKFYFTLLILDEKHSPKGVEKLNEYSHSLSNLDHRHNQIYNLCGIGRLNWHQIADIFRQYFAITTNDLEKTLSQRAIDYLNKKIN